MRAIILAAAAALLCACGGDGEGGGDGHSISPYYPDNAPHLTCEPTADLPCCDPVTGPLECPEGSEYEENDYPEEGLHTALCRNADGQTFARTLVVQDGAVRSHMRLVDGTAVSETCNTSTGYIELRRRFVGMCGEPQVLSNVCRSGDEVWCNESCDPSVYESCFDPCSIYDLARDMAN